MRPIVFLDTETTSLRHDRRAWEVGLIVRNGGTESEHSWFVRSEDLDLGNANLGSLAVGKFYNRHPAYGLRELGAAADYYGEERMLREVEVLTRDATIVGIVPAFDTDVLAARMRAHDICPSWHYHVQDAETLAVGYLRGKGEQVDYPVDSMELSLRLGVAPSEDDLHTAIGDARWAMRLWDAVMA